MSWKWNTPFWKDDQCYICAAVSTKLFLFDCELIRYKVCDSCKHKFHLCVQCGVKYVRKDPFCYNCRWRPTCDNCGKEKDEVRLFCSEYGQHEICNECVSLFKSCPKCKKVHIRTYFQMCISCDEKESKIPAITTTITSTTTPASTPTITPGKETTILFPSAQVSNSKKTKKTKSIKTVPQYNPAFKKQKIKT